MEPDPDAYLMEILAVSDRQAELWIPALFGADEPPEPIGRDALRRYIERALAESPDAGGSDRMPLDVYAEATRYAAALERMAQIAWTEREQTDDPGFSRAAWRIAVAYAVLTACGRLLHEHPGAAGPDAGALDEAAAYAECALDRLGRGEPGHGPCATER